MACAFLYFYFEVNLGANLITTNSAKYQLV